MWSGNWNYFVSVLPQSVQPAMYTKQEKDFSISTKYKWWRKYRKTYSQFMYIIYGLLRTKLVGNIHTGVYWEPNLEKIIICRERSKREKRRTGKRQRSNGKRRKKRVVKKYFYVLNFLKKIYIIRNGLKGAWHMEVTYFSR